MWWFVIAASGIAICALAVFSAATPTVPLPSSPEERAAMWQRLHGADDVDPMANPMVRLFLRLTHAMATPLARAGVLPDVLTLVGVWVAAVAFAVAHEGSGWVALAGGIVIISALTDGVDGAVAGFTARESPRGQVLDSVADRISEALFFAAIVRGGGSAASGVAAMAAVMLLEYTRARVIVANRGISHGPALGPITVGERPTRVIGVAVTLVGMGVAPRSADFIGTWGPVIIAGVTTIGWLQLVRYIARW